MNIDEFKKGRIEVPFPLRSDAYTIASDCLVSAEAKQQSCYNFTNRRGPADVEHLKSFCKTNNMHLYGLTDFLRNELTHQITHAEVERAHDFMKTAHISGGALKFNADLWHTVVSEHNGYLPIKIEALPEGSMFLPGEPVIQVKGTNGFGELAAFIEPLLVGSVSIATARLSITRHWFEQIRGLVAQSGVNADLVDLTARFFIHDFGMRASSCSMESEMLGRAHLLVFNGTDTFNAAYQARVMGAKNPIGTSILALAHRIVQGYKNEFDCFENLAKQDKIGSYLPDCYDFANAVHTHISKLIEMYPDNTFVIRSDSGKWNENLKIIKSYMDKYDNVRYLNGDSINPDVVSTTEESSDGNPERGGYGCGGYLRNTPNRDIFHSAYKLSGVGLNSPVMKFSNTPTKESCPGPNKVCRYVGLPTVYMEYEYVPSSYVRYYENGEFTQNCVEDFNTVRSRVSNEFRIKHTGPLFSDEVIRIKQALKKENVRNG